jgi:hypothetical protein
LGPDDLALAPVTQVWLSVSDDPAAMVKGQYFDHKQRRRVHPAASAPALSSRLPPKRGVQRRILP